MEVYKHEKNCRYENWSAPVDVCQCHCYEKAIRANVAERVVSEHNQTLEQEITSIINRRSLENASDTPDFILAEYLMNCLRTFNWSVNQREKWYGRKTSK